METNKLSKCYPASQQVVQKMMQASSHSLEVMSSAVIAKVSEAYSVLIPGTNMVDVSCFVLLCVQSLEFGKIWQTKTSTKTCYDDLAVAWIVTFSNEKIERRSPFDMELWSVESGNHLPSSPLR